MGTRADFYIETKKGLEFLGSIGWDGYPSGIDVSVLFSDTGKEYKAAVTKFLAGREDASLPKRDGWVWPWENSNTTDYAYVFSKGKVLCSNFGSGLFNALEYRSLNNKMDSLNDVLRMDELKKRATLSSELNVLAANLEKQIKEMREAGRKPKFPDMTKIQKVSFGSNSGLMVISRQS
jgi:hypothetical protein